MNTRVTDEFAWLALDQLKKDNLLEESEEMQIDFGGLSRREVIRKIDLPLWWRCGNLKPDRAEFGTGSVGFMLSRIVCNDNDACTLMAASERRVRP